MCLSEREGDGVFNPFRTSVHEKCATEHCFCIFNYPIMFPLSKKLSHHQQSFLMIKKRLKNYFNWFFHLITAVDKDEM